MADDLDRKAIQRWLEDMHLQGRSEVAETVAARAALRALPLLAIDLRNRSEAHKDNLHALILAVFRIAALPWVAIKFPTSRSRLRLGVASAVFAGHAAENAASFSADYSHDFSNDFSTGIDVSFATQAAGDAARSPTLAVHSAAALAARSAIVVARSLSDASGAESARDAAAAVDIAAAAFSMAAGDDVTALRSIAADVGALDSGRSAHEIAGWPLWPSMLDGTPQWTSVAWQDLKAALLSADGDWDVWIDWYEARLAGERRRPPIEALEIARATIADEIWKQGPAMVNAEIRRLIEEHRPKPDDPAPDVELGPILEVGEHGLELTAPTPLVGGFDQALQSALHQRLKRLCPNLVEATRRVANAHPGLMSVVSEYADLVAKPLETLDVISLWAVGTGLLANREAFARFLQPGGMSEPLEPEHYALLRQASEIHGAFILGFPRGRELTDRADHSRLTPEIIASIMPAARALLDRWRHAKDMVEARTRKFLGAIEEGAIGPSWGAARASYSAYVVTRNALIGIGKLMLQANSAFATVVGGLALSAVDPNLVQTQLWLHFVLQESQTILAFSEPFPELKIWLGSIIDMLERDEAARKH